MQDCLSIGLFKVKMSRYKTSGNYNCTAFKSPNYTGSIYRTEQFNGTLL